VRGDAGAGRGSPGPAFLVVADAFFPGWSAQVDGRPAPLYRVDHLLRGLPVPAGRHRVTLEYEPEGGRSSCRVARAAATVWLLGVLAWLGSRARRARVARP